MAPVFEDAVAALRWMEDKFAEAQQFAEQRRRDLALPITELVAADQFVRSQAADFEPVEELSTGWLHPAQWQSFGPLPVLSQRQDPTVPQLPPFPLNVAQEIQLNRSEFKRHAIALGRQEASWGATEPSNGLILPHFFGYSMYIPKSRATAWQAHSRIFSPRSQEMRLRLQCVDAGQLWLNGRLIYSTAAQDFRLHTVQLHELSVPVRAGENELIWYVRSDYARTWAQLQYRFDGEQSLAVALKQDPQLQQAPAHLSQTVWSHGIAEHKSQPTVHGDSIALMTAEGALQVRDLSTGLERWRSESLAIAEAAVNQRSAQPLAITNDAKKHIAWLAHLNGGKLGYFSADGQEKWQQALPMTDVSLIHHRDSVIAIGRPIPDDPKKFKKQNRGKFIYEARAFAITDGSAMWERSFAGNGRPSKTKRGGGGGPGIHQPWTQHLAVLQVGEHAVAVIRGGVVLNLSTGELELPHLDPWIHGEAYWHSWGSWLFASSHGQLVAMRWGFDDAGNFQHQEVWRVRNELSSFGNTASVVSCDGRYVYHHLPIPEHAPHSPGLWTQLHVHDLQTGNPISELRPAIRDALQHRLPILTGQSEDGPVAFLTDAGGGQYARDQRAQINVIRLGEHPRVIQRWFSDQTITTPPILTTKGVLIRERGVLTLLSAKADSSSQRAADLMNFIGPKPTNPMSQIIDAIPVITNASRTWTSETLIINCHLNATAQSTQANGLILANADV